MLRKIFLKIVINTIARNFTMLLIFFILITNSLFALEPVMLTEEIGEYPIGLYLEILEDKEGKYTIDDVQNPEMEKFWVRSKWESPNFGYTKVVYWTRFKLQSETRKEFYLEIGFPHLDRIDFFILADNKVIKHRKAGDFLPFSQRDIRYRNFTFSITPFETPNGIYIFRIAGEGAIQFPISIWSPITFTEKKNTEMMGMGLYFGVMFVMVLYNLFIWFSIRDRSYLYYVLFIFFSSTAFLNNRGLTFQYFWIGSPILYNQLFPFSIYLVFVFSNLFTQHFLLIKQNLPVLHVFYKLIFILLLFGCIASPFIGFRTAMVAGIALAMISCIWMLCAGIIMVMRSYRPARFFLFAWTFFLLGGIVLALLSLGLIPKNNFTDYSIQIGSVLEVILLSLGLADRINDLKKQNEVSQIRALQVEKRSSKVKDEFLANLSHELKTPLTTVYAYSEMLTVNKDYSEEVRSYSKEIYAGAQKLNDYMNDLMLITDIESNLRLQKSKIDLQVVISKAVEQNNSLLEEKEIQLEVSLTKKVELMGDQILLEKAIAAIIKNAIAYNKQKGNIQIFVGYAYMRNLRVPRNPQTSHEIQINIADTGVGIAEEFHEKMFEKFFRVDSALTYEVSGVGVGLYIAKKIVELHMGSIEVKSELGIGSEITINLPMEAN